MAHATLVFQVTSCESHYESVRRVKVGTGSPFDQGLALITSLCGTGWDSSNEAAAPPTCSSYE